MITEDTVLILGAGASADYDFPLGRDLIISISQQLGYQSALYNLLTQCHFQPQQINDFRDHLRECNLVSIDAFLENRKDFERIGKVAIAGTLIPYEMTGTLSRRGWYEYLHQRLIGRKEEFSSNRLTVVTFNYDRSFEAALFIALQKSYNLTDTECASYMKVVPVIHVYGQLGGLPHLSANGRHYNSKIDEGVVNQCVGGIKIVHEAEGNTQEFQQAQEALAKAKTVCCLGFGYHPENVKRLDLSRMLQGNKRLYLSAFGLTPQQTVKLNTRIFPSGLSGTIDIKYGAENSRVLDFLRETAALE